jgi:hypothetical protein
MGKYNLCIIDDKIPVDQFNDRIEVVDTGIIEENILTNYLKFGASEMWGDSNLYNLVKSLRVQGDIDLTLSAFKTHSFYFNYIDENLFSPDIIIFDWDVGASEMTSEESLKKILEGTYCLVAIYTEADRQEEIKSMIEGDNFKQFKYRLFLVDKNKSDSAAIVIDELKGHLDDFSFNYGREFKHCINTAINTTFCRIGCLSFSQFVNIFGDQIIEKNNLGQDEKKSAMSSVDFIEIMNDHIKTQLLSLNTIKPIKTPIAVPDENVEKQLWHFRMFHTPKDNLVRKGDIVFDNTKNKYFMVVSSDCHLTSFWSKNLGFLTIVPLYKCDDIELVARIKEYIQADSIRQFKISSLTNPQRINCITIIPALDGLDDYILSPKEIESIKVERPVGRKVLFYDDLPSLDAKKRYRLNEPFLGALIEYILRNITDIGTPDYSKNIQETLRQEIKNMENH